MVTIAIFGSLSADNKFNKSLLSPLDLCMLDIQQAAEKGKEDEITT